MTQSPASLSVATGEKVTIRRITLILMMKCTSTSRSQGNLLSSLFQKAILSILESHPSSPAVAMAQIFFLQLKTRSQKMLQIITVCKVVTCLSQCYVLLQKPADAVSAATSAAIEAVQCVTSSIVGFYSLHAYALSLPFSVSGAFSAPCFS